jgi:hypothetical protein
MATHIPANQLRFAGDVNIEKAMLVSTTGVYQNITNQILQVRIYEDIFSPFISGSLIIKESFDFMNLLPLVGEELIELKIITPTIERGVIQGTFHVYKMSDRVKFGERATAYELNFISIESLVDTNKKISKVYSGKISDVVGSFVHDKIDGLETKKNFLVENTRNTIKYISNYWSPVKNLSFLAENSISETQSPSFVFFENRDGFNFRSLEKLYKAQPVQQFVMDKYTRDNFPQGGNILNILEDYKRIGEVNYITNYDYIDRLRSGMLSSKLISYDSTKKTYTVKNYSAAKRFESQDHLNKYPVFSPKLIARSSAQHILFPRAFETFTSFGDTTNARILQERISFMKMAEAHKIQISVPGRCDYTVGMVVDVTLYQNKPIKKTDRQSEIVDKVNSGKYLISAIYHDIKSSGHDCWIELIKDSMMKEVA